MDVAIKLYDSELKVMEVLWREGELTAKRISEILNAETGWNVNTTYTVIKKCVAKGAIERREPNFLCRAIIPKSEVRASEARELMGKLFDGSPDLLFASVLNGKKLSREQIARLRQWIDAQED